MASSELTFHERAASSDSAVLAATGHKMWHHGRAVRSDGPKPENLSERDRSWLVQSEALWREAHAITAANPTLDPGDVYHALRALDLAPAERLRRGLTRVRHRSHSG